MLIIVFSKDRALQLDATIQSLYANCIDIDEVDVSILYTTTLELYENQYKMLIDTYSSIHFIREKDFKNDLIKLVDVTKYSYIMFVVDDTIFIREFNTKDIINSLEENDNTLGFSLRVGMNTTYCYMQDRKQILPEFTSLPNRLLKYNWKKSEGDFAYPLEVSSSVYGIIFIFGIVTLGAYSNPNQLEALLHKSVTIPAYFELDNLLCYKTSRAISLPLNKVQTTHKTNRCDTSQDNTIENLAKLFDDGHRINIKAYKYIVSDSVHKELPLVFKERV